MRSHRRAGGRIAAGTLFASLGWAAVAAAGTLAIDRWTVDTGGTGFVAMGSIVFAGTAGQPDAGFLPGRTTSITGGFWVPLGAVPLAVGDGDDDPGPGIQIARVDGALPNPLRVSTRIRFELPNARDVEVQVFDVSGAHVRTLQSGRMASGRHALEWDVRDRDGRRVAPGVYLVHVRLGDLQRSLKLSVLQ